MPYTLRSPHRFTTLTQIFPGLTMAAAFTACTTAPLSPPQEPSAMTIQAEALKTYNFKKGQLVSFVSIISKDTPEAKQALKQYYETAFPLAEPFGLKREGQLTVKTTAVGEHKSEAIVIYSWPDKASEGKLESSEAWADVKALRPVAWEELRIYTDELQSDLTLTFDPRKTYTLAMAWNTPENPDHYDLYMEGIKEAVTEVGGRFVYKMFDPKFESNKIKDGGPGQVTLVEWDSPRGLQDFGKTEGFKQNVHYLGSGVKRFEILVLGTS